jgi:hypothetical protein
MHIFRLLEQTFGKPDMDIFELTERMNEFIVKKDWFGLIAKFQELCTTYAGSKNESMISSISITAYESKLRTGLEKAISKAKEINAKAVYFEYDLDNDWQGKYFICKEYLRLDEVRNNCDNWACDYEEAIPGPRFEEFGKLYIPGFDCDDEMIAVNSYLIARTVAAFGKVVHSLDTYDLAIGIAFRDQDPIVRIKETYYM